MKRKLLLFLGLIGLSILSTPVFAGCYDPRSVIAVAKTPTKHTPVIAMHRGLWGDNNRLPENSIDAFIAADRMCIEAIETDVRLTKDNVPVLLHDSAYGRTTDIFQYAPPGDHPYIPETNTGYNKLVEELAWDDKVRPVSRLNLLIKPNTSQDLDPNNTTAFPVETVESFYQKYYENRLSVVVFLEVKDAAAFPIVMKQLYSDRRDYNHGLGTKMYATDFTVLKFSVMSYPTPKEYQDALNDARRSVHPPSDMKDPLAFPAYTNDFLYFLSVRAIDPWAGSMQPWTATYNPAIGVEINLKLKGGILQPFYDKARARNSSIGIFHAAPDFMRVNPERDPREKLRDLTVPGKPLIARDAFYRGQEGGCCYQLSDLLDRVWDNKKDNVDMRGDPRFIAGPNWVDMPFKIATTDDYPALTRAYQAAGIGTGDFAPSPLAGTNVYYRSSNPPHTALAIKRFDGKDWVPNSETVTLTNMNSAPSSAMYHGSTYVFYQATSNGELRYVIGQPGTPRTTWMGEKTVPGVTLSNAPSAYVWNDKLYVFHKSGNTDTRLWYVVFDGSNWSEDKLVPTGNLKMSESPAVTAFMGALHVLYRSTNGELVQQEFDGRYWLDEPRLVNNVSLDDSPAVVTLNGKLYIFHRGMNANRRLYYEVYNGLKWTQDEAVDQNTTLVDSPTATVSQGKIFIVHQGGGDNSNLYYGRLDPETMIYSGDIWVPGLAAHGTPSAF